MLALQWDFFAYTTFYTDDGLTTKTENVCGRYHRENKACSPLIYT
jgi:hypothetical protein